MTDSKTIKKLERQHQAKLAKAKKALEELANSITLLALVLTQHNSSHPDKKQIVSQSKRIALANGTLDKRSMSELGLLPAKRKPRATKRTQSGNSLMRNIRNLKESLALKKETGTLTELDKALVESIIDSLD